MRIWYYLNRGLEIYRSEGLLYLLRAAGRFLAYTLVDESTRFQIWTKARYFGQSVRYHAPKDPFEVIYVDPNEITTANYELTQYRGLGLIRDGDWDASVNNQSIEEYWSIQGIRERFVEGKEWEKTVYYTTAEEAIAERGEFWRYEDIESFKRQRCRYVDSLYEDIKENGYRSNADNEHNVPERLYKQKPHQQLEVLVTIGRDGEILFRDGHHRIALAQILDVDTIPVNVLARHKEWQHTRDRTARANSPSELRAVDRKHLAHPDLTDVAPREA